MSEAIRWFHSIDLGDEVTSGEVSIANLRRCADLCLTEVEGKTVLDIGAWDGFYSFEAERRGAQDVLATDHFAWSGDGWGTKAGFDHAYTRLGSKVRSLDVDMFSLDPCGHGTFDVVLFMGVLYHLENPFGGLKRAAAMSHGKIVVETASDLPEVEEPAMRFYPSDDLLLGDPSNFFAPNRACLEAMLRHVGFRHVHSFYVGEEKRGRLIAHGYR